ncbi:glycosyltransferase, partial [Candidatus Berkelbacteria bacterium]|nr:glycosyltransferase [Candidatus Berkelbacteria bacterium]
MLKTVDQLLAAKSVAVVSHYYGTGPIEALREFLPKRVAHMFWRAYPLYQKGKPIITDIATGGHVQTNGIIWRPMPEIIRYMSEIFATVKSITTTGIRYDCYIGIDSLNALAGIILKKLGRTKKVVFYTIDFVPQRFANPLLNTLYHRVDRFCVEHADMTWNLSYRMMEGREMVSRYPKALRKKQMELPIGVWWERIKVTPFSNVNKNQAMFVGHITEKQGLQLVIEAMPEILTKIPHFTLDIIGDGPYRAALAQQIKAAQLEKNVTFHGFVKDDRIVEHMIAQAAVTLALYRKENDPFTYYADPGKIKIYLATGVPVVL